MTQLDERVAELDVEEAAASVDRALGAFRHGVITSTEAFEAIKGTTSLFLHFAVASADDLDFVTGYSRLAVEELALLPKVMDPVLIEAFDDWLHGEHKIGEFQARLDELLEPLRSATGDRSGPARSEIAELCRSGRHTFRMLLRLNTAASQILHVAYEIGCAEGLRDAVSPEFHNSGQIARRDEDQAEFVLAMNLLAQLAADPERGSPARASLIDLADHLELTAEAVVRLPMHLLDDEDRARLLELHHRRADLLGEGRLAAPLGIGLLRDSRLVRGAVWQAFDARHIQ